MCASLTAVELVAADVFKLQQLSPQLAPSQKLTVAVFLVQYLAVKFYRIFLYPYFFSPLRHLPGPKVCLVLSL